MRRPRRRRFLGEQTVALSAEGAAPVPPGTTIREERGRPTLPAEPQGRWRGSVRVEHGTATTEVGVTVLYMLAVEPSEFRDFNVEEELGSVRLRLVDVTAELDPLSRSGALGERLRAAVTELHSIIDEVVLLEHIQELDESGIEERLEVLDRQVGKGWRPDGRSAEDIVATLRARTAGES
jgi:hypothetical protein